MKWIARMLWLIWWHNKQSRHCDHYEELSHNCILITIWGKTPWEMKGEYPVITAGKAEFGPFLGYENSSTHKEAEARNCLLLIMAHGYVVETEPQQPFNWIYSISKSHLWQVTQSTTCSAFPKELLCCIPPFSHTWSKIITLWSLHWLCLALSRPLPVTDTFVICRDTQ